MISLPPRRLQSRLIFYIICIIVFTNGFFAIITLSRENLGFYQDGFNRALYLGKILQEPAREGLKNGNFLAFDRLLLHRELVMEDIPVTLYRPNWSPIRGDPPRPPPEGYPSLIARGEVANRSGFSGKSSREFYWPLFSGEECLGVIGIGVPEFQSRKGGESLFQVGLVALVNIFLGITLAIFISQIILRPLNLILEGLESVRKGDFHQRVQVGGGEELEKMGNLFNTMAASLEEKTRESSERTRLLDEKVQELWEIYELTKAMGFSLNLQAILTRFMEKAMAMSFSSYVQILLSSPETLHLEPAVESSSFPRISREIHEKNLRVCQKQQMVVEVQTEFHTLLYIPLMSGSVVHGLLFLGKVGQQGYSEGVRRFLDIISPLGGSLIENARLYQHVVEMKNYVQHVLDSVDSGVATIDGEGRLITMNAAFGKLLGIPGLAARQQVLSEALSAISDREFVQVILKMVGGRDSPGVVHRSASGRFFLSQRKEVPFQLFQGNVKNFQIRVHPLLGADSILGKVLVLDDMTQLKVVERQMYKTEKWVSLGKLAASVAHEVRNPLVAIRGLVEIIGEDLKGDQARHVQVIIGEVNRLNRVVEEMLSLTRPVKAQLKRVSLFEVFEELLILVHHEVDLHRVSIRKEWPEAPVHAKIDPEKVKQAFLNIMLNAIQAMPRGGVLTLRLRETSLPDYAGVADARRAVTIEFVDEGEGIPKELQGRVFDPFFTTRPQGTGLGLTITKKIVDIHQGAISIDSNPGKGATVRISLPIEPEPPQEES